jgi:hypothetical protein
MKVKIWSWPNIDMVLFLVANCSLIPKMYIFCCLHLYVWKTHYSVWKTHSSVWKTHSSVWKSHSACRNHTRTCYNNIQACVLKKLACFSKNIFINRHACLWFSHVIVWFSHENVSFSHFCVLNFFGFSAVGWCIFLWSAKNMLQEKVPYTWNMTNGL